MIPGRVNIIIPLYNQEQYVEQCLLSAMAQTYKNFDITIVNDGSTDCSRRVVQEVLDRWNREDRERFINKDFYTNCPRSTILPADPDYKDDPRDPGYQTSLRYRRDPEYLGGPNHKTVPGYWNFNGLLNIIDQENRGLSESRNRGIREADGEYFLPLDSDDWIDPNYLELAVPKMADPEVGLVAPTMQYEGLLHNKIPPKGFTLEHQMRTNDLPVCSLIRRSAFDQTPGYETIFIEVGGSSKVLGYEDWNLTIDLLKRGWKIATVPEPVFHYRVKPVSMITQATKLHDGLVKLIHLLHPDLWPR